MNFNEKLNTQMRKKNITVQELVKATDIGKTTISEYLKETYPKSLYFINKLAEALDVSVMYLADDKIINENYIKADIGESLNISDGAIEIINKVKDFTHFDNDIYYKQNEIKKEINLTTNFNMEDISKRIKETEYTYSNKTFSCFIENFEKLPDFLRVFCDFMKLKETYLNIDYLKTICKVKTTLKKYMKKNDIQYIDRLINIYDTVFEAMQFTSYGSLLSYHINNDIKETYNKIKDILKTFDIKEIDDAIDELQNELFQSISYINKELRRCEYEMNLILSEYYEKLITMERQKFLENNTNIVNSYINKLLKENEKLEKRENKNVSSRNRKK